VWEFGPRGHNPPRLDVLSKGVHRRPSRAKRQDVDAKPIGSNKWIGEDIKCIRTTFERLEGRRDVVRPPDLDWRNRQAESAARRLNFDQIGNAARIISIGQAPHLAEVAEEPTQEFETFGGKIGS